ncbi:MAG TPA: O-antigen ligase family protein, partial [Sphingomicrobium sp.]|nr:O-antigen ligase family protein [Sphingomicrobium sp.]
VGFFANSNHMGSLLVVCIPFAVALLASSISRRKTDGSTVGMMALGIAGLLVVLAGLVLNRSLAALGIALPVLLFSALLLPGGWKFRRLAVPTGGIALAAAMLFLVRSAPWAAQSGSEYASVQTRAEMWSKTGELAQHYFPVGSGLGSFTSVFRLSEDPATVGLKYVNHAHNDYLELLLELGAPGAILLVLFLAWWAVQTVRVWRSGLTGYYARAATIASGALLAHSLVDYPLRTAALSSIFGMCLAFMAQPKPPKEAVAGDRRGARHMAIG